MLVRTESGARNLARTLDDLGQRDDELSAFLKVCLLFGDDRVVRGINHHLKTFSHQRAPIKRIQSVPVPDRQTQLAKLITGEVGVITNVTEDMAAELAKQKNIAVTPTPSKRLMYITIDAAGRSANKAFNIDNQSLDVEDIGSDVTDHLSSGSIVFDVTNPFGVAMTATVRTTAGPPGGCATGK